MLPGRRRCELRQSLTRPPRRIILGVAPGEVVADIGAGSGWFTVRVAKRVTETGRVYAVDINPETIRYINQRIQKENLHNVKTILSKPDDPLLPANKIDSVLLLKTHHEVEKPVTLLRKSATLASNRGQSWSHRPQRKRRKPWSGARGRDSRGLTSWLHQQSREERRKYRG